MVAILTTTKPSNKETDKEMDAKPTDNTPILLVSMNPTKVKTKINNNKNHK